MPADTSLPTDLVSDLPPRTWRGWWMAWPKWFRIGCWAALGLMLLHVAAAVRIPFGLVEGEELAELRRRGGDFRFAWESSDVELRQSLKNWEWMISGLVGRSGRNVCVISLDKATDDDIRFIVDHFPNLQFLNLTCAEATKKGYAQLGDLRWLSSLSLSESNIDDQSMEQLTGLKKLKSLFLFGTAVSDASICSLQKLPSLRRVNFSFTNVTAQGLQAWREKNSRLQITAMQFEDGRTTPSVSIVWSDGVQTDWYRGPYSLSVGPILTGDHLSNRDYGYSSATMPDFLPEKFYMSAPLMQQWSDGKYEALLWINDHESQPVYFQMANGKASISRFEFRMPVTKQQALEMEPISEAP